LVSLHDTLSAKGSLSTLFGRRLVRIVFQDMLTKLHIGVLGLLALMKTEAFTPIDAFELLSQDDNVVSQDRFLTTSTLYFNSTTAVAAVSIGAILILLVAVGLYLYDFYATARSDTVPQYNPYGQYDPNYTYRHNKR
jgi:hypothetical protein